MSETCIANIRNTHRMHHFFNKMKKKEPVKIAFLGGSITQGYAVSDSVRFSDLLVNHLREHFENPLVISHNYGVPGIPSIYGLYQATSLLPIFQPNLVFIEFATNDVKDTPHRLGFESLVDYCLNLPKKPAVVILFAGNKVGYTCKGFMELVAQHYDIPSVYIDESIRTALEANKISWEDYSNDYGHPNENGHRIIQLLLWDFLKTCINTPDPGSYSLPTETLCCTDLTKIKYTKKEWFHLKQNHSAGPYKLSLKCRYLMVLYHVDEDVRYGTVTITVDGEEFTTLCGYRIDTWPHTVCAILELGPEVATHEICFAMQKGEEAKCFALQDIGYC